MRWIGFVLVIGIVVGACGGGLSPGSPCTSGEQGCSDNKEFNCESGKWKVAKDCSPIHLTCSLDSKGDADCR
jgi:hypothetical protein